MPDYFLNTTYPTCHNHPLHFEIPSTRTNNYKYSYYPKSIREQKHQQSFSGSVHFKKSSFQKSSISRAKASDIAVINNPLMIFMISLASCSQITITLHGCMNAAGYCIPPMVIHQCYYSAWKMKSLVQFMGCLPQVGSMI